MANPGIVRRQVLVFTDPDGNIYALPREIVEQHRLTPEQRSLIVDHVAADEVTGLTVPSEGGSGQPLESRRAEYIEEASDLEKTWSGGSSGDPLPASPQSSLEGVMIGAWRMMTWVDPGNSGREGTG